VFLGRDSAGVCRSSCFHHFVQLVFVELQEGWKDKGRFPRAWESLKLGIRLRNLCGLRGFHHFGACCPAGARRPVSPWHCTWVAFSIATGSK
jgi:hypothetical protein